MVRQTGEEPLPRAGHVIRFADDFVCAFQYKDEAERFYQALPERLAKFGLQVAPEKTRIHRFSRFHPSRKRRFTFLGFEFYWEADSKKSARLATDGEEEASSRSKRVYGMAKAPPALAPARANGDPQAQSEGALQLLPRHWEPCFVMELPSPGGQTASQVA